MNSPKIIILGHTGFIGKAIFERLTSLGISVKGVSSSEIDLRKKSSVSRLGKLLTANTILIFSAAVIRQKGDNLETLHDNIKLAVNIASAIEKYPVKKCVYLSTADVYGFPDSLPINEKTPINPQTYYATAKYCSESILQIACQRMHIPFLTLRYSGIFGPGQKEPRYGPNSFIYTAIKEGVIKLWGDGKELRDMVYVRDLANIIVQLSRGDTEGTYNIATGRPLSFKDAIKYLEKILPYKFSLILSPRNGPRFDQTFDISKLRSALPDFGFLPMEKALEETYNYLQESISD